MKSLACWTLDHLENRSRIREHGLLGRRVRQLLGLSALLLALLVALTVVDPARAADEVCVMLTYDGPALCPTEEARQVSVFRPVQLPVQEITPVEYESRLGDEKIITPDVYAWIDDYTPIYRHPAEAAAGLPPVRVSEPGYTYVSLEGKTEYEGEQWYQINVRSVRNAERADEYLHEDYVHLVRPSSFVGVYLAAHPSVPFGWVLRSVRPSPLPGEAADPNQPMLYRYHQVNIYGVEEVGNRAWYLIGVNQWIRHDYLGIVNPNPRPEAVAPGEKWIEVDLYEQTLAAYEGDRMVFATLVSSGLPQWPTRRGLFRIWDKIYIAKMSGREGKPDYYYLEDVPWTMYFDGGIGLHGAYWHDSFGYRHSHGCVNLPPIAAQWLYAWTDPQVPEGVNSYVATGTWVWVH
jgi:hypothetical protein